MGKYDDIMNQQWPKPSLRQRMNASQRAKIFLPFAALTGYEDSLEKIRQITEKEMEQKPGQEQFYIPDEEIL